MSLIKSILILLAALSFLLNISPLISSGEINPGMLTGFAFSAALVLYVVFFRQVNLFVRNVWSSPKGKAVIGVLLAFFITASGIFTYTFAKVITHSVQSDTKTEYIIVLGCKVSGTEPGLYLRRRINKAYEYLTENPDSKAVLSGGKGDDEGISEGQCMFNCLTEMGISADRLIIEDRSASTQENMINSVAELRARGHEITEMTIVTNDFHEYRSSCILSRSGVKAYSFPAKTPFLGYTPFAVREVYAVIVQVYLKNLFG